MTQPPEPTWDGEGTDPWLPARLAHAQQIVTGERSIYDEWFAKLSAWLVGVRRDALRGPVVDPASVWRHAPAWLRAMSDLVAGPILDLVGVAYRNIFGPGYSYDQRPYVVDYLAQARNRLLAVPDQVYDQIVQQIAEGALAGESIPDIKARVQLELDPTASQYWPNRATVVARTETAGAFNAGRQGAFQQLAADLDEPFDHMWLATVDDRTRPTHREADLQRVPLGRPYIVGGFPMSRPGDPKAPAQEVIQCRCTELLLSPGEDIDLSDRQMVDL